MDFSHNINLAFSNPRDILVNAMEQVAATADNVAIRYYSASGSYVASIMLNGAPGQRNFVPTVHVVVDNQRAMITVSEEDEDFGSMSMVALDSDIIAGAVVRVLKSIPSDAAYELEGEPSDDELAGIEASHSLDPHADGDDGW